MLTDAELADALAQLDRLLALVAADTLSATPTERAYLEGAREALVAVLRPDEREETS